jgi:hypothetical protein
MLGEIVEITIDCSFKQNPGYTCVLSMRYRLRCLPCTTREPRSRQQRRPRFVLPEMEAAMQQRTSAGRGKIHPTEHPVAKSRLLQCFFMEYVRRGVVCGMTQYARIRGPLIYANSGGVHKQLPIEWWEMPCATTNLGSTIFTTPVIIVLTNQ